MNTSGPLQSYCEALCTSLTLQETRSIHDPMNISKIEFISYVTMVSLGATYFELNTWRSFFHDPFEK